ncbi:MAG: cytochrome c family protein [Candidatus Devosia symbiotica]|nr:cytochrome c family protein [Candidatus Devosia symbiotica]
MDSFELNKIIGAVLGTLLFVMGTGFVAEAIYHPIEDNGPGYALPEPTAEAGAAHADAAPAEVPLAVLLAKADPAKGASAVKKCQSCHNFGENEPSKQGPQLYAVVGRPEGSVEGFGYSDGMKEHNAAGDVWSYENLNAFLTKPSDYVKGTKMAFAGIKTAEERADVLAYLQTLSHDPVPFPAADAAAATTTQ